MTTRIEIFAALVGFTLTACNQLEKLGPADGGGATAGDTECGGGNDGGVPAAVQDVFDRRCATAGCHDGTTRAQGLDLSLGVSDGVIGKAATQSALPLVELGNVDGSYLALKVVESPATAIVGARMPVAGSFSDPNLIADLAVITDWIAGMDVAGSDGCAATDGGVGNTTGSGASDSNGGGSTTPSNTTTLLCGIEDLKPGATNPIDAGDAAMQIPTEIGTILAENCGCHYVDGDLSRPVTVYPPDGPYKISTLAEWQGDITQGRSVLSSTLIRLQTQDGGTRMPKPVSCDVGGGEPIAPADLERLVAWIEADAPDGANWP